MKNKLISLILVSISLTSTYSTDTFAESKSSKKIKHGSKNRMELDTLTIQGNKELPKVLFVVPWQEVKSKKGEREDQGLILHSLYGDIFDPVTPKSILRKN